MALTDIAKNALRTFGLDVGGGLLTNAANIGLSAYQNRQNLRMWERNNAYNTPQAQMQRFVDAGLNPNLIYGQGSAGNSGSPVTFSVPKVDMRGRALDHLSQYMTSLTQDASRRSTEEDIENKAFQRMLLDQQYRQNSQRFLWEVAMKPFEMKYNMEAMRLRNEQLMEDIGGRRLANKYARDTYADRVQAANLANALTFANIGVARQSAAHLGIQTKQAWLNYRRDFKYGLSAYLTRNELASKELELLGYRNELASKDVDTYMTDKWWNRILKTISTVGGLIPFSSAGHASSGSNGFTSTVSF